MPIYAGPNYEERIETSKISPADLNTLIQSGADTFQLVDVRDPEEFAEGHIPDAVTAAIEAAYTALVAGDESVAVRSSATAEDLPDLSFAGQQETFLNVRVAPRSRRGLP